jgi:hypothetical protein
MLCQPRQSFHIKDTEKGPTVWEVKRAPFWLQRDDQVLGPYWLIYTRNILDPNEEKYFLSNASPGTPLETILHVAFARWPIERTLEDEKDELGLSHFEVRKYDAIMRHMAVTQVSHLFLAHQAERLRGEKSGDHFVPSADGHQQLDRCPATTRAGPQRAPGPNVAEADRRSTKERTGSSMPHRNANNSPSRPRNQPCRTSLLRTKIGGK